MGVTTTIGLSIGLLARTYFFGLLGFLIVALICAPIVLGLILTYEITVVSYDATKWQVIIQRLRPFGSVEQKRYPSDDVLIVTEEEVRGDREPAYALGYSLTILTDDDEVTINPFSKGSKFGKIEKEFEQKELPPHLLPRL